MGAFEQDNEISLWRIQAVDVAPLYLLSGFGLGYVGSATPRTTNPNGEGVREPAVAPPIRVRTNEERVRGEADNPKGIINVSRTCITICLHVVHIFRGTKR